ncbi:MAG TPA: metallophosphoesterase [Polyangiaceae bacterium]|nr:metallophosphoesterase [Polyangiaceae bacterium]
MPRPLLVVSDLHLSPSSDLRVSRALARAVGTHPDAEVVIAGDSLDLSLLRQRGDAAASVAAFLRPHGELIDALSGRLRCGAPVTFVLGNHDAALGQPASVESLTEALGVSGAAPLQVAPWFVRRGAVHIEHGHAYDPDNADVHPLASDTTGSEPLGIALTRRFLAPSGALWFKHQHHTTPLSGLISCFKRYGVRAPKIVGQYFWVAAQLCLEARNSESALDARGHAQARLAEFSAQVGVTPTALDALIEAMLPARHLDARDTFLRLYFDRPIPTATLAVALPLALAGNAVAAGVALASAATLAISLRGGVSRYDREAEQRLQEGARFVRELTEASHVILGHTHVETQEPGYTNLGSFAFSRRDGHAYLLVGAAGSGQREILGT